MDFSINLCYNESKRLVRGFIVQNFEIMCEYDKIKKYLLFVELNDPLQDQS